MKNMIRKVMRKLTVTAVALSLCVSGIPYMSINAQEAIGKVSVRVDADNIKYSGTSKDLNWSIDNNGKLTITGTGDYKDPTKYNYADWEKYSSEVKSAVVNVTGITNCNGMFENCSNMETVTFQRFVGTGEVDFSKMFFGCRQLKRIDFSGFQRMASLYMDRMFYGCNNLETVDLTKFNTSKCTCFTYMFSYCYKLSMIDISGFSFDSMQKYQECNIFADASFQEIKVSSNIDIVAELPLSWRESWFEWYAEGEKVSTTCLMKGLNHAETYKKKETANNGIYTSSACEKKATEDELTIYSNGGNVPSNRADAVKGKFDMKKGIYYTKVTAPVIEAEYDEDYCITKGKTGKVYAVLTTTSQNPIEKMYDDDNWNGKQNVKSEKEAKALASVSYSKKNNSVTVKAKGNKQGEVYLWVFGAVTYTYYEYDYDDDYDFDDDYDDFSIMARPKKYKYTDTYYGDIACAKITIQPVATTTYLYDIAPTGAAFNISRPQYKKDMIEVGTSTKIYLDGTYKLNKVRTTSEVSTYSASVDPKASSYFEVAPAEDEENCFVVSATAINGTKPAKGSIIFQCDQNGKKVKFSATAIKPTREIILQNPSGLKDTSTEMNSSYVISAGAVTATGTISMDRYDLVSGTALTDSPKVYMMSSEDGYDKTAFEKGKVKITSKPYGDQKKLKVKLSRDKKVLTVTATKKIAPGTKVYVMVFCNNLSEQGYRIFSVEVGDILPDNE